MSSGRPSRGPAGSPIGRVRRARPSTPSKPGPLAAVIFDDLERELHRSVDYAALFRFRNAARLDSYWVYRAETAGRARSRGVPVPMVAPAGTAGARRGHLLRQRDGYAALRWTDQRTDTYGVLNAVAGSTDLAALYRQWQTIVNGNS